MNTKRILFALLVVVLATASSGCMITATINRDGVTFGAKDFIPLPEAWKRKAEGMLGMNGEKDLTPD